MEQELSQLFAYLTRQSSCFGSIFTFQFSSDVYGHLGFELLSLPNFHKNLDADRWVSTGTAQQSTPPNIFMVKLWPLHVDLDRLFWKRFVEDYIRNTRAMTSGKKQDDDQDGIETLPAEGGRQEREIEDGNSRFSYPNVPRKFHYFNCSTLFSSFSPFRKKKRTSN